MINKGMSKDKTEKQDVLPKNGEKAMFRANDHLVIKDKKSGKVIINKRG